MFAGKVWCTSIHCCCKQNTLSPSFTKKQRSSFVFVLQEKCDEPTNKTALGQFRFGFLGAGWFVPPRSYPHSSQFGGFLRVKNRLRVVPHFSRLQNSPYFCVFKYARAVTQKVWNEAENREGDLQSEMDRTTSTNTRLTTENTSEPLGTRDNEQMRRK